jgi:hypothetical protein
VHNRQRDAGYGLTHRPCYDDLDGALLIRVGPFSGSPAIRVKDRPNDRPVFA